MITNSSVFLSLHMSEKTNVGFKGTENAKGVSTFTSLLRFVTDWLRTQPC